MPIEIRTITEDEMEPFARCQAMAFGRSFRPESLEGRKDIFEFDRNYAAFDGETIAGTCGIFSHTLTVPGGSVKSAGVTMVSVRPTHRRRGILTAMMARQLEQVAERGEPVATLWASESLIYGRFGYGLAHESVDYKISRDHARFRVRGERTGTIREVDAAEARESWPALRDAQGAGVPGWISRTRGWWEQRVFRDPPEWRDGYTENIYLTYEGASGPEGYLRYRVKDGWDDHGIRNGTVRIDELVSLTPAAYAALWEYALSVDLVSTISAEFRRVDEPLLHMLEDPRRLIGTRGDGIWLRVVDVETALSARRYAAEGEVVLGLTDTFRPRTSGNYLLSGGPSAARCVRTDRPAEVYLGIEDLGAAYLGGTRLSVLAEAGRVTGSPAAIARADAMFAWHRSAWCPEMF